MVMTRKRSRSVATATPSETPQTDETSPPSVVHSTTSSTAIVLPGGLPIYPFASAADLESFLEREHLSCPGFYLKLAKKKSGVESVSPSDAVEAALCFGWIDGWAKSLDDTYWVVRYTPRRSKSMWSQKNVQTVQRLMAEGKMRPSGLEAVESAMADGRWDRAYAGPATITMTEDFTAALEKAASAKTFWDGLNKSEKYAVLWRIQTASPKARDGRIRSLVQGLAAGEVPGRNTSKKQIKSKAGLNVPAVKIISQVPVRGLPKQASPKSKSKRGGEPELGLTVSKKKAKSKES